MAAASSGDFLACVSAAERRDVSPHVSAKKRAKPSPRKALEKKSKAHLNKPKPSSPSAARVAAAKAAKLSSPFGPSKPQRSASNGSPFVAAKKEAFSVTNQPKLKHGNVAIDLQAFGYTVLGPIAAGAYSTIVCARHGQTKREVAIKTFAHCDGMQAQEHAREVRMRTHADVCLHVHVPETGLPGICACGCSWSIKLSRVRTAETDARRPRPMAAHRSMML